MTILNAVASQAHKNEISNILSRSLADAYGNPSLTMISIGLAVAKIRENLGISHKELARMAQMERSKVAKAERIGFRPDSDKEAITFAKIARGVGLNETEISSLVKLYIGTDAPNNDIGTEIKRARIAAGPSVGDLAHLTGMRRGTQGSHEGIIRASLFLIWGLPHRSLPCSKSAPPSNVFQLPAPSSPSLLRQSLYL